MVGWLNCNLAFVWLCVKYAIYTYIYANYSDIVGLYRSMQMHAQLHGLKRFQLYKKALQLFFCYLPVLDLLYSLMEGSTLLGLQKCACHSVRRTIWLGLRQGRSSLNTDPELCFSNSTCFSPLIIPLNKMTARWLPLRASQI